MEQVCTNPNCFFCAMKHQDSSLRRNAVADCFREMAVRDDQENVVVLSGIWNIAMTQPDDPEFPSLGVFSCMSSLIRRGINDRSWLLRDQNIYIPYYAAHVIGSYTMNKVEFAETAVESGVIPPLMELLRGKISWVEQRVAVRALSHLASYEKTFEAVAEYEEEAVTLAMELASSCFETIYTNFVGVKEEEKRPKYHGDLLTRGVGGIETENRKAEEWASQLQCWCLYLLNCFACKERSLSILCKPEFLQDLAGMWGGLVNHRSPSGVGLIRILCYSKYGRKCIAESEEILRNLCNLSRSSDDWQYMGIDCLLLLLRDQETRNKVLETSVLFLVDLIELRNLGDRENVGETITKALLMDQKPNKWKLKLKQNDKVGSVLTEIWEIKVERRRKEKYMSEEQIEDRRVLVSLIKQEANYKYWFGDFNGAIEKYSEALDLCPVKLRKERMVLYSNRAECHLLLKNPDAAINDSTRALSLSSPANSHNKSLWRRSQAYDMKGLAKESLMDCIRFLHGCISRNKAAKIPFYAARMMSKQMDATWLFAAAKSKSSPAESGVEDAAADGECRRSYEDEQSYDDIIKMMMEKKGIDQILFYQNFMEVCRLYKVMDFDRTFCRSVNYIRRTGHRRGREEDEGGKVEED